jgi:receptor protein-tyrosine kinase
MSASFPRRPHLVERAADAARAAMEGDALLIRAPRPPLAPVQAIPATIETAVPPAPQGQAVALPGHDEPAPVTRALLRRAGLIGEAGPAREEMALVREQVLRTVDTTPSTEGRQARLVMITSARSGEGKSFAALNLAASIVEGTHRPVILVDAAQGAGSLSALVGLRVPGLEQLCNTGGPDPVTLLRRTEIPGLFVLPHGTAEPSAPQGSAMAAALLHLAGRLPDHLILLDTPACLESSIAGLVAAAAGQVTLVVEAERSKRREVETALDILDACPTLQLLLNRVALRVGDRFKGPAARAGGAAVGAQP